eukprot:4067853-Amphidinium_carterae.1
MVMTMGGHPVDGVALQGQGSAISEDVLQELRCLEGPVCQLPQHGIITRSFGKKKAQTSP